MASEDRGVAIEIDGVLLRAGRHAQPAAHVDLHDPVAGGAQAADRLDRRREGALEAGQPLGQPARARVEMDRVDLEVVPRGGGHRLVQPLQPDPELGRPVARVLEVLVVAGAGARVDPDPDRAARCAPSVALDLADRVEVQVDAVGEQHVEVALGHVGAGVADLLGAPAALDRPLDLARRAGIDADALRAAGRAEGAQDLQHLGPWVGLEREPDDERKAGPCEGRLESAGVLGEPGPVVDEERRPVLAGERLGVTTDDPQPAVSVDVETRAGPTRAGRVTRAGGRGRGPGRWPRTPRVASTDSALPRPRRRGSP